MWSNGAETGGFVRTQDRLMAPDLQTGPLGEIIDRELAPGETAVDDAELAGWIRRT